jgi:hypothetical protein
MDEMVEESVPPFTVDKLKPNTRVGKMRVLFDYVTGPPEHLAIHKDDVIVVSYQRDGGWWQGHIDVPGSTDEQPEGLFPANYCSVISVLKRVRKPIKLARASSLAIIELQRRLALAREEGNDDSADDRVVPTADDTAASSVSAPASTAVAREISDDSAQDDEQARLEREAAEKEEQARLEREAAEKEEQARLEREAAEKEEQARLEREKEEQARLEREKEEQARLKKQQVEREAHDRQVREREELERQAQAQAQAQREMEVASNKSAHQQTRKRESMVIVPALTAELRTKYLASQDQFQRAYTESDSDARGVAMPRPVWVPDNTSNSCRQCHTPFTLFFRRVCAQNVQQT